ncbi:MAG: hypothetical protein ACRDHL_14440 [Candidatus Promineifilaceae bacterium]
MAALEAAAEAGDEHGFLGAYKSIEWRERPPQDFARAIRLAIQAGAHLIARHLAEQGTAQYAEDVELQQMSRTLAPPVVRRVERKPSTGWAADREWLKAHWDEYRGRWVALKDGQFLAAADSLDELVSQVGDIKGAGILVTPVW